LPPSKLTITPLSSGAASRRSPSRTVPSASITGSTPSARAAISTAIDGSRRSPRVRSTVRNQSGTRRMIPSSSSITLTDRMFRSWPTANLWAGNGLIGFAWCCTLPRTTLPARAPSRSASRNSRSKPGTWRSTEVGKMRSKPTTRAPPSITAWRTRAISGVHIACGRSRNGGWR